MKDLRLSELHVVLLAVCLAATVSCRGEAISDTKRANTAPGSALPASPPVASHAANQPPVAAAPALSSSAAPSGVDCGGPPSAGAPLPTLEKRTLAEKKDGRYRFELQYPLLRAGTDKVEQKVNRLLGDSLGGIRKRFLKEAENQGGEPDPDNARWFEGKCEVVYDSPSFVSVGCDTMEGPGAHPNLDKFAHNFQICPEVKEVALADLCRSLPECRMRIVALINEDFRTGDKKQTGIQFRVGPAPSGEPSDMEHPVASLQSFGITPAGLRFFLFDELPHVLQAFAVVDIPADKLRSVLREGAARALWRS